MGPGHFWWGGGLILSIITILIILVIVLAILRCIFWRRHFPPPWWGPCHGRPPYNGDSETAIEILKKRYAKGEITKEEFEQIKKDLIS